MNQTVLVVHAQFVVFLLTWLSCHLPALILQVFVFNSTVHLLLNDFGQHKSVKFSRDVRQSLWLAHRQRHLIMLVNKQH